MARTPKASLAFKKENASVKTTIGANVINCLDDAGTLFPALPISIGNLQDFNSNLVTTLAAKVDGGRAASLAFKAANIAWDNAFTSTADYVSMVANGDESIIVAGGFTPTKTQTQRLPKPGPVTNFDATINGSKGAIIAGSKKAVSAAKAFLISAVPPGVTVSYVNDTMIITAGENNIYLNVSINKETEIYNLPSGVPYTVSMFAVNSAGRGPVSAVKEVIPQ